MTTVADQPPPAAEGPPAMPAGTRPARWREIVRDRPILPLLALLVALVAALTVVQPGIELGQWATSALRFAIPLAILAACQTMVMLTGGIDLSVAAVATVAAYVAATQVTALGEPVAITLGLTAALVVGLVNGIGVGIFRVQPLIMTLGMGLVVAGFLTVYQVIAIATAAAVPRSIAFLGTGTSFGFLPNSLLLFVPIAAFVLFMLARSGFGRMLYAIGDNPTAARLAGIRVWSVQVAVYTLSGLLAGIAGFLISALAGTATLRLGDTYLLPSVAAVVIGGTSIFGGRGGYTGSIVGALILTVLVSLLTALDTANAVRTVLYGVIILVVATAYTRITEQT